MARCSEFSSMTIKRLSLRRNLFCRFFFTQIRCGWRSFFAGVFFLSPAQNLWTQKLFIHNLSFFSAANWHEWHAPTKSISWAEIEIGFQNSLVHPAIDYRDVKVLEERWTRPETDLTNHSAECANCHSWLSQILNLESLYSRFAFVWKILNVEVCGSYETISEYPLYSTFSLHIEFVIIPCVDLLAYYNNF
jgi:hypothetical protein